MLCAPDYEPENLLRDADIALHRAKAAGKGRYEFFDYMVMINKSTEIIDIKILKYRSEYGYEITNKGWLKQFYNKPGIRFDYRKNIDTLSGATFSAQSLVNDINLIIDHLGNCRDTIIGSLFLNLSGVKA